MTTTASEVRYFIQTNHKIRNLVPLTDEDWKQCYDHYDWHSLGTGEGTDDFERANKSFLRHCNLARVIWLSRLIDSNGVIHKRYDPERDMRLPGCRWREIERRAYYLWESAGKPESDGVEFWLEAEKCLEESNGVF